MSEHGNPISDVMAATLQKLREMLDVNTIVGEPIRTPDGLMLIPISRLSMGFASGGSEFGKTPKVEGKNNFGGGAGAGIKMEPIAFVVVRGDNVRLLPVGPGPMTTLDRVVDSVPDVVDKVIAFLDQRKAEQGDKEEF